MDMDISKSMKGWLKIIYVSFAFCSALFLGALKALLVGPIAGLIVIIGNVGVILGLFPAHVVWTIYTVIRANRFDIPVKVALLFALPSLFGIWLGLSIAGSVLVGVGYGFFAPWVSAFEAFRQENESKKFVHCVLDGTVGTIEGSCTVVRDFTDFCYHSYPVYLKELRDSPDKNELPTSRLMHIPGSIIVGMMGLIVEIPLFTSIALVKSPYLLFKGWHRLIHDLVSREGPFLETACIPVAGLTILLWPIVVVGSILMAVFSSFFIGLYGAVVVYQERSFRRGVFYVIAMVAEFDEYTNDWLYLREGTILPKPRYRKKGITHSSEFSVGGNSRGGSNQSSNTTDAPAMLVPSLVHSRSVREALQEVKMVQVWRHIMKSCEMRGRELLDANVIRVDDLNEWSKGKNGNEAAIVGVGLPCYAFVQCLLESIKVGSDGLIMMDGLEITHMKRPKDRLLDWFFQPILVLKEQIKVIKMGESEVRFLEKVVLFGSNGKRMEAWENGGLVPQDALRAAQIQGISRRMMGMIGSMSKLPTYRRRFSHVVKALMSYSSHKDHGSARFSTASVSSTDIV